MSVSLKVRTNPTRTYPSSGNKDWGNPATNWAVDVTNEINNSYTKAESNANYYTKTESNANYAPIAKGVTNGDTHDHSGGDGSQIDHTTLSNKGTNTHSDIDTYISTTAPATFLPISVANLTDAQATEHGNFVYLADIAGGPNDIAYYGGNKATIIPTTDGGTVSSIPCCRLIPKKMKSGLWIMIVQLSVTMSSSSRSNLVINFNGTQADSFIHIVSGYRGTIAIPLVFANGGGAGTKANITWNHSAATATSYIATGTIALGGIPDWIWR